MNETTLPAYRDPDHPKNGAEHHTGKLCVERCGRPAGTAWSPYWCQPCNAERLDRVEASLRGVLARMEAPPRRGRERRSDGV